MKKIIPFKKDIIFKTNLSEITSISLEHTLQVGDENNIVGEFILSGDYKLADTSVNTESFLYNLPFEVSIDDKYLIDNINIDIDDFYYEIINNNILSVNIEVLIDKLQEKPLVEPELVRQDEVVEEKVEEVAEEIEEVKIEELDTEEAFEEVIEIDKSYNNRIEEERHLEIEIPVEEIVTETNRSLFDSFDSSSETYTTYKVYIIREGDTIEGLIENYKTTKEDLEKYNDLSEISIGDKIIIPAINEKV